jgi:hypothetical protein
MDINQIKTLAGLTLAEASARLDEQLPAEAYSAVPGGADLTDIDPNWMREVLNSIFGICGFGWGYEYDPANMQIGVEQRKTQNGSRTVSTAFLKHLRFWYKVVDAGGQTQTCSVDASGASENSSAAYAMKGAITNALGNAASNIGFQKSVYLGHRSHKTVRSAKPAPAAAPATSSPKGKPASATANPAPAKPVATSSPKGKPAPASDGDIEDVKPAPVPMSAAPDFIIEVGQRKGQKLGEQPLNVIQWYAEQMAVGSDPAKEALKKASQALVKVRSNGHEAVAA